jgi:ATP-binding cassette subfamily F protein 2
MLDLLIFINLDVIFYFSEFPDIKDKEEMRKIVGRYGLTGREQVCPMKQLSDGQRCRVSFAWLGMVYIYILQGYLAKIYYIIPFN